MLMRMVVRRVVRQARRNSRARRSRPAVRVVRTVTIPAARPTAPRQRSAAVQRQAAAAAPVRWADVSLWGG